MPFFKEKKLMHHVDKKKKHLRSQTYKELIIYLKTDSRCMQSLHIDI